MAMLSMRPIRSVRALSPDITSTPFDYEIFRKQLPTPPSPIPDDLPPSPPSDKVVEVNPYPIALPVSTVLTSPKIKNEFKSAPLPPGVLITATLVNINIHKYFHLDCHNKINYITGDNGSGKTSLMEGILFALGASASELGKKSLNELIYRERAENSVSEVSVELTHGNNLDTALYGNTIAMRRVLDTNRTKTTVRMPNGSWRRLTKKEQGRILFAIHVSIDNPIQFLIQNVAADFFKYTTPKRSYTFFYEGVGLERCEKILLTTKQNVSYAEKIQDSNKTNLADLQKNAGTLRKELQFVKALRDKQLRRLSLQKEHAWSIVIQLEKEAKLNEAEITRVTKEIAELKGKIERIQQEKDNLDRSAELEALRQRKLMIKLNELQAERKLIRKEYDTLKSALDRYTSDEKSIQLDRERLEAMLIELNEWEENKRINYEKQRLIVETRAKKLEDHLNVNKTALTEAIGKGAELEATISNDSQVLEQKKQTAKQAEALLNEKRVEFKNVDKVARSQYDRFGRNMVKLMDKIKENVDNRRFQYRPLGPQGACYSVKEMYKEYARIIEHIMFGKLWTFKVTTSHDVDLLSSLINSCYGPKDHKPNIFIPQIKIYPEKLYDMKKKASGLKCPFPTLLDTLDIVDNDPAVVNWLIDTRSVDRILMFPSYKEGCDVLTSNDDQVLPPTTIEGYTPNFERFIPHPTGYKFIVLNVRPKAYFVRVTTEGLNSTELLQRDLEEMEFDYDAQAKELKALHADLQKKEGMRNQGLRHIKELTNAIVNAETQKLGLVKEMDNLDNRNDLDSKRDEIQEFSDMIKQREKEIEGKKVEDGKAKVSAVMGQLNDILSEISSTQKEMNNVQPEKNVESEKIKLSREEERLAVVLRNVEMERDKYNRIKDRKNYEIAQKIKEAERLCKRIVTKRSSEVIKHEMMGIQSTLEKHQHKLKKLEVIQEASRRADEAVVIQEKKIKILDFLLGAIRQMIYFQENHFHKTKLNYGVLLTTNFNNLIATRHFLGELHIDHVEKDLSFYVCSDEESKEKMRTYYKKRNDGQLKLTDKRGIEDHMRLLSGGEQTFSTFCFFMSILESMENFAFFLDEYEVFLDDAHRAKCQEIIRYYSQKRVGSQFFIFLPRTIENMPPISEAKVIRLVHPNRKNADNKRKPDDPVQTLTIDTPEKRPKLL